MIRRFNALYLILVLIFLVSTFTAGCSLKNAADDTHEQIAVKQLEEAVLKIYFMGVRHTETSSVLEEIEKRTKDSLNVRLDFKWVLWDEYEKTIRNLISSGDSFDAFEAFRGEGVDQLSQFAKDGLLLDMTAMFPDSAPRLYSVYSKEELEEASHDGKLYGVPMRLPVSYRKCAVVREDLLSKYGIASIKNFEDYEAFLAKVKENDTGMIPGYSWGETVVTFAEAYGYVHFGDHLVYRWDDPGIKLIPWEQTPEYQTAYNTYKKWSSEGLVNNSVQSRQYLKDGRLGSMLENWITAVSDVSFAAEGEYRFEIFPLYPGKATCKITDSIMMVLNNNSMNPDRALRFFDWIQSNQENYDLFIYGLKDKHYVLKDDGRISFSGTGKPYYGWDGYTPFLNIDNERTPASSDFNYKQEYEKCVGSDEKLPPTTGFVPDKSSIQDLISKREQAYKTMEDSIRKGDFSKAADTFIIEQKNAGADQIVEVLQGQLDSWKKSAGK